MNKLELETAKPVLHTRRPRDENAHKAMRTFTTECIDRLLQKYEEKHDLEGEYRRQIRDLIRRFQQFEIQDTHRAHYLEEGTHNIEEKRFEHAIPVTQVCDLLIREHLNIQEALDSPTVLLTKETAESVQNFEGKFNTTPYRPFLRYRRAAESSGLAAPVLGTIFGTPINLNEWTLEKHFDLVKKIAETGPLKLKTSSLKAK